MRNNNITLYHSLTSVCSQKVRLTLAELDIGFESRVMDLKKGDQFAPEYLKLNPNAVVPTLVDGDCVVLHSNEIMRYLCGLNPPHPLSAASNEHSESCSNWLDLATRFHVAINAITYVCVNRSKLLALSPEQRERRFQSIPDRARSDRLRQIVEHGFDAKPVSTALAAFGEILPQLQEASDRNRWLTGDHITLADYAIFPFVHRLHLLGFDLLWAKGSLTRWHDDVVQRPAYNAAVGSVVPSSAIENFATSGLAALSQLEGRLKNPKF